MKVAVLDQATGDVLFRCAGPDPFGGCPSATDGELPCTGHRLAFDEPARLRPLHLVVTGHGPACPLRALMPGI